MKKTYNAPKMVVHGNFEKLTQAAGNRSLSDILIINGRTVETNDDSLDVICTVPGPVPCPTRPAR